VLPFIFNLVKREYPILNTNSIFELNGIVIEGAKRGRQLGYPTANLDTKPENLPKIGVYAVMVNIKGRDTWHMGAASVGYNPTFGLKVPQFEVHILDFDEDIYGETLQVECKHYLRDELKFDGLDALIEQIEADCTKARELLS
jgi:riboflavin kinase/FMN adenylyltransferase